MNQLYGEIPFTARKLAAILVAMKQTGISADGLPTMADVFVLTGTHGIPLEIVLGLMKERNLVVSWPHYVADALKDGAKMRTIEARVFSSITEIYGPVYSKSFRERWDQYFERGS